MREPGFILTRALVNEAKRQQAEIEQWKEESNKYQNLWCEAVKDLQTAKTEAIKEFAERLKEKAPNITEERFHILRNEIDNLVKEMVGDDNA